MANNVALAFKKKYLVLLLIIILGFFVRQYRISNSIADWHSWRQSDTAAVARIFYEEGFNPFIPKYDDMSPVEGGVPNPNRYRFVEFPIYNTLVYFAFLIQGGVTAQSAREVTVIISLVSVIFIYLITKRYFDEVTAFVAAFLFAVLPYNIYYSRVVLPDPLMVLFGLGMLYFTDRWIFENTKGLFVSGLICAIGALLVKPTAVFYMLPLVYSLYIKEGKLFPIPRKYLFFVIASFLPLLLWRIWIGQHPEGIPASSWLLNGNGIRLKPAFWKWIISDRFGREILTVPGTVLFFLGLLFKPTNKKEGLLLHLLALSSFLYLIIFATGNVQHDYYQILIVPALVIFLARGFVLLFKRTPSLVARFWTIPFALLFLSLTLYFGWNEAKGLFQINNDSLVRVGDEANRILPKNALVIAPNGGDTTILYNAKRHGFPIVTSTVPDMVSKYNVSYYLAVAKDPQTKWVMEKYTVLEDTQYFVIVDLTKENPKFNPFNNPEP